MGTASLKTRPAAGGMNETDLSSPCFRRTGDQAQSGLGQQFESLDGPLAALRWPAARRSTERNKRCFDVARQAVARPAADRHFYGAASLADMSAPLNGDYALQGATSHAVRVAAPGSTADGRNSKRRVGRASKASRRPQRNLVGPACRWAALSHPTSSAYCSAAALLFGDHRGIRRHSAFSSTNAFWSSGT